MKTKITALLLVLFLFLSCQEKTKKSKNEKAEKITAVNDPDLGETLKFELYSDSSYIFTITSKFSNPEKTEKFNGACYVKNDTLYFSPQRFKFNGSGKAVIKNNFIEFIDPDFPLRIEIKKNLFQTKSKLDFKKYSDYAVFTFDPKFYGIYFKRNSNKIKPHDLNQEELIEVDRIVKKCFDENSAKLRKIGTYVKQCIVIINEKQEKEILVNCFCKSPHTEKSFKYSLIGQSDGGNCNIRLRINLTKHKYSDLNIAGQA